MTLWRTCALCGVSAAAVLVAVVPFKTGRIAERDALDWVAAEYAAVPRAAPPRETNDVDELLAQDMASLARRGGGSGSTGSAESPPAQAEETLAQEMASLIRRGLAAVWPSSPVPPAPERRSQAQTQPPVPAISPAAQAYRKGDTAALAALARSADDPDRRLALEWAALRSDPHPSFSQLSDFAKAHPSWPGGGYLRYREEAELLVHPPPPAAVVEVLRRRSAAIERRQDRPRPRRGGGRSRGRGDQDGRADCGATAISTAGRKARSCANSAASCRRRTTNTAPTGCSTPRTMRPRSAPRRLPAQTKWRSPRPAAAAARGPFEPDDGQDRAGSAQERSGLPVRADPGRAAVEPPLRGGDAALRSRRPIARPSSTRTSGGPSGGWSRASFSTSTSRSSRSTCAPRRRRRDESANRVDRRFPCRLDRLALSRRRERGGEALCARRGGGGDAAVDRPRRLLARPRRRGDGRCGRGEAPLRERGERADRLLRPARRQATRGEEARASRAGRRRRGRPARRGGAGDGSALRRRARRPRDHARLRGGAHVARRGADGGDGRGLEAAR